MPLFENSVIYKIVHKDDQDNQMIYIGSTTNFRGRKYEHKGNCCNENKKEYNFYVYQYIRENGGWDEWEMIAIETYPCESKRDLEIRERYWIEKFKSKLNKIIPTRNKQEFYEKNKEQISEMNKEYYEANKERICEMKKEYYEANKEKIREYKSQIVTCECGCEVTKSHLSRHMKNVKHKNKMKELNI